MKTRRARNWTNEQLKEAVKTSYCLTDVLRKLGLAIAGGNHKSIKDWIDEYELDISHFRPNDLRLRGLDKRRVLTNAEIFCKNSNASGKALRRRAKIELLYECFYCNLTDIWFGKSITLELDHINGIRNDNRKENLRWLCPNCHSQTETFAGKNK